MYNPRDCGIICMVLRQDVKVLFRNLRIRRLLKTVTLALRRTYLPPFPAHRDSGRGFTIPVIDQGPLDRTVDFNR